MKEPEIEEEAEQEWRPKGIEAKQKRLNERLTLRWIRFCIYSERIGVI